MALSAWGIKLGSGGRAVDFCEKHQIVGVGWEWVDAAAVAHGSRDDLFRLITAAQHDGYNVGSAAGQLHRFRSRVP
jgi:hypothetical protein